MECTHNWTWSDKGKHYFCEDCPAIAEQCVHCDGTGNLLADDSIICLVCGGDGMHEVEAKPSDVRSPGEETLTKEQS